MKEKLTSKNLFQEVFERGLSAFRQNILGMLSVATIGAFLLLGYSFLPSLHAHLDALAKWKIEMGIYYPLITMGVVAGIFPIFLNFFLKQQKPHFRVWVVALLYWPYRGLEIDFLYRGLGHFFGQGTDLKTILIKMFFDMGLYVPFFSLPLYVLVFAWQEHEDPMALLKTKSFWRERYLPGVFANWLLWIPAVAIIYSLPSGLQLMVQNLFMLIWLLIIAVIAQGKTLSR